MTNDKGYPGTYLSAVIWGLGFITAYIVVKLLLNALGAGELLF